jgi:mannose-6-phosphate isomerase-like protein (cupin superfamily)
MAYKNKVILNPLTGHEMKFLQTAKDTNGKLLEIEATYHAASKPPAPHYHPAQDEVFTVLEGTLAVQVAGQLKQMHAGDILHIPRNTVHAMWNPFEAKTVVNWQVRPALNTEQFLETGTGLAADGKLNKNGMPPLLQVALLANHFAPVYRLPKPPFAVQRILFWLLTPIAYLKGYRATYAKYLE